MKEKNKIKIYNKRNFYSGIVFLLLSITLLLLIIIRINTLNSFIIIIKHVATEIILTLLGITQLYRSLNIKSEIEYQKDYDERKKLIELKSKSLSFNVTFLIAMIISIICIILLALTHNTLIGGILIGISIIPIIMIISEIISYNYYDRLK